QIKHAAYLLIAPLAQNDLEPGVRPGLVEFSDFSRGGARAVFETHPAPKSRDLILRRHALHLHLVNLPHVVARRRDVVRQLAVVRQNQKALCVEVETTDGVESSERLRDEFGDERSAFGVCERREIAARLVEQDVNFLSLFEERV